MNPLPAMADASRLAAARTPDGLAIVDGTTRWSWRVFDARVGDAACGLWIRGIGPGDRVALCAGSSADAVAVLHGIARMGAVAVPIGTGLTAPELARAAAVLDPILVVHDVARTDAAAGLGRPLVALADLFDPGVGSRGEPDLGQLASSAMDPAAPAVVILTSGTTGHPRAAVLSAAAVIASAEAWLAAVPARTGWLLALGLGHVAGLGVMWRAALEGVPLTILARPDPATIAAALTSDPAPSHVSLVPTMLARTLDAVADGPPPDSLRAVLVGGGPIPATLVTRAIRAGWPVIPTYGLTEAGSGVTAMPTEEAAAHPDSAGRPLPGVHLRVVDRDASGVGDIQVRSPALFSGYAKDPGGSALMVDEAGWLRTGDLGRLDEEGRLIVSDRRTDLVIRGGENISPAEVEAVLLQHPAIADVAVVARRDPTWGQVPVAAFAVRPDMPDPGFEALQRHCLERLATFKVPVVFVRLPVLPRTASGKIRRADLRARLDHGVDLAATSPVRYLGRPGGVRLAYRRSGDGPTSLVLLHGTLSSAGQLSGLARSLTSVGAITVLAIDRRGSGGSRLADPAPVDMAVHVADVEAVLDAEGLAAAILVGVSFGGVVALEAAARLPGRVLAVVAYEPPYGPVADADTRRAFAVVARATERAFRRGGAPSAAEAFMRGVAGAGAWDRLPERTRASLTDQGDGAFVDAGLSGLDPNGLARIRVPVTLLTGDASEPFYRPIAEALLRRIPDGRHVALPGLGHAAPITDPARVADAVRAVLADAALLADPQTAAREPTT